MLSYTAFGAQLDSVVQKNSEGFAVVVVVVGLNVVGLLTQMT